MGEASQGLASNPGAMVLGLLAALQGRVQGSQKSIDGGGRGREVETIPYLTKAKGSNRPGPESLD